MRYLFHLMIGLGLGLLVGPAMMQDSTAASFDIITPENAALVHEIDRIQAAEMVTIDGDPYPGDVYSTAHSHDSRWLVTTGYGGIVKVWDSETEEMRYAWNIGTEANYFVQAIFSPDDRWLVIYGRFDDIVTLFDMKTGQRVTLLDPKTEGIGQRYMHFSLGAENHIAVGFIPAIDSYSASQIEIWDLETQTLIHQLPATAPDYLRYSPEGDYLMSGRILYDANTWQVLHDFKDPSRDEIGYITFLTRQPTLLYALDRRLGLWNIETHKWVWQIETLTPYFHILSLPGEQTILLTDEDGQGGWFSSVLDSETGEILTVWEENTGITIEEFSTNGELMVLSVQDSIELWDVRNLAAKTRVATIFRSQQPIASFSPDGRTIIVTDSYDPDLRGKAVILAVSDR